MEPEKRKTNHVFKARVWTQYPQHVQRYSWYHVLSYISWKFYENPFTRCPVMLLTKRQENPKIQVEIILDMPPRIQSTKNIDSINGLTQNEKDDMRSPDIYTHAVWVNLSDATYLIKRYMLLCIVFVWLHCKPQWDEFAHILHDFYNQRLRTNEVTTTTTSTKQQQKQRQQNSSKT